MKSFKTILFFTLLASLALQKCSPGCISCDETGKCNRCYDSYLNPETHECEIGSKYQIEDCAAYTQIGCDSCKEGYSLKYGDTKTCIPNSIKGCYNEHNYGESRCLMCRGGTVEDEMKSCSPSFPKDQKYDNCEISLFDGTCYKCKKGYIVQYDTEGVIGCIDYAKSKLAEGCVKAFFKYGFCLECDNQGGFYMSEMGKCSPMGTIHNE